MTPAFPERIETTRLVLRRLVATDAEALLEAVSTSRPELERWMRWPTRIRSFDEAREVAVDAAAESIGGTVERMKPYLLERWRWRNE